MNSSWYVFSNYLHVLEIPPLSNDAQVALLCFWQSWSLEKETISYSNSHFLCWTLLLRASLGAAASQLSQHFLSPFHPTRVASDALSDQ